jgi:hypothetical protein
MRSRDEYLGIYLNDHAAGAMSGVALARRISATNAGTPQAEITADLAEQIADIATHCSASWRGEIRAPPIIGTTYIA